MRFTRVTLRGAARALALALAPAVVVAAVTAVPAQALTPLAPPTGVLAWTQTSAPLQINLSWTDPTPNDSASETGFEVWRCAGANCTDFTYRFTSPSPSSAFGGTDFPGVENTTFTYRVRAVRGTEVSAWSNTSSATTSFVLPATPTTLLGSYVGAATSGNGGDVQLTWGDAASTEVSYAVRRCELANCLATDTRITLPPNSTSYRDTTTMDGVRYSYSVAAVGAGGASYTAWAGPVTVTSGAGLPAPTRLTASATSTTVSLKWRNSTRTGSVEVWRCVTTWCTNFDGTINDTFGWTKVATLKPGSASFIDSGVAAATSYTYRVRAWNPPANASPFGYARVATP